MKQLTKTERQEISILKQKGYSQRSIAAVLGRDVSTISRELRRNSCRDGRYDSQKAQQKFWNRWKKRKPYMKKIRQNNRLEEYITEKLRAGWSPEQVAGRWSKEQDGSIARCSIYRYLHSSFGWKLKRHLPHRGKKWKRGKKQEKVLIPHRTWIDARPRIIGERKRFGHYEGDTIVSRRGDKTSLLTILEKMSRYLLVEKVANKQSEQIQQTIAATISGLPIYTITFDNGVEFAHHYKLSCDTYFCHPYSSWEKGQVEYANRLIRRFFPKKTLLKNISQEQLQIAIEKINNTPRKCLNWNTPQEVFLAHLKNPP